MEGKKKRGSNYTAAEKEMLVNIVKKYQNIIENKETNANMILKKRKSWDTICQQYNAIALSGPRTWQQLRHLYENLKQRTKKNLARENRLQYYEKTKEIQRKASLDKKEINRTGGGAYKSTLTGIDSQILAMAAPQIQPLSNPYDDAAIYFGDIDHDYDLITSLNKDQESSQLIYYTDDIDDDQNTNRLLGSMVQTNHDNPCIITTSDMADDQEVAETTKNLEQASNKPQTSTSNSTIPKQRKPKEKPTNAKQQYFKTKLRNAKIEQKFLINRNKMKLNKYKLEMEFLKLKLQKLKYPRKR